MLLSNVNPDGFIITGFILFIVGLLIYLVFYIYNKTYENFVLNHSVLLKNVKKINEKYHFYKFDLPTYKKIYDNRKIFETFTPKDYLTYQLVYDRKEITSGLYYTDDNRKLFKTYMDEIKQVLKFYEYDEEITLRNEAKLLACEKKLYKKLLKKPILNYYVTVELVLTKMNNQVLSRKSNTFNEDELKDILKRLDNKLDGRYQDESIWESISKIERAKVSNKMRFAVYERDHYRCQKCGRKTKDLEIDHIFPISKGGKTEFNNLQTLCHDCNVKKSDTIETVPHSQSNSLTCPKCGASLKLRQGKYGKFYGCMNYPKCNYTQKVNNYYNK